MKSGWMIWKTSWCGYAAKANQTAPRSLIDKLMQVLGQEQKQVREEIEERIRRHVRDIEKKGFDPSIP